MKLPEILKRMLVPRLCFCCSEVISYDDELPFCEECIELWRTFLKTRCKNCGLDRKSCPCLPNHIKEVNSTIAVWCVFYDSTKNEQINKLFFELKRSYNVDLIDFFASIMVEEIKRRCAMHEIKYSDYVVTYIPRRRRDEVRYSFNHSKKLAERIAKALDIKLVSCFINVGKKEQKRLNLTERRKNAEKSFQLSKKFDSENKNYFIVDDIFTSGSTIRACAELLFKEGAENIIPVAFGKDN